MNKLYWDPWTAAFAAQALLEETGEPYEILRVDLKKSEHRTAAYLALNPGGYVPTLITDQGLVLTESAAILLYLADKHPAAGLAPATDDPVRGTFLRWLFYLSNNVQSAYKRYYYAQRHTADPAGAEQVKAQARADLIERWGVVEARLAEAGPYLLGADCSAADIFLYMLATWFEPMDELLARAPALARCCDLVAARPAIARTLRANEQASQS